MKGNLEKAPAPPLQQKFKLFSLGSSQEAWFMRTSESQSEPWPCQAHNTDSEGPRGHQMRSRAETQEKVCSAWVHLYFFFQFPRKPWFSGKQKSVKCQYGRNDMQALRPGSEVAEKKDSYILWIRSAGMRLQQEYNRRYQTAQETKWMFWRSLGTSGHLPGIQTRKEHLPSYFLAPHSPASI